MKQHVSSWLGVLAVLLVCRVLLSDAYKAGVAPGGLHGIDFRAYYDAAADARNGRPLYDPPHEANTLYTGKRYVYPPLLALVIEPLPKFAFEKAFHVWVGANVLLLAGSVLLFAAVNTPKQPGRVVLLILFLVMAFRFWPTSVELAIGQADLLLLALLCGIYAAEAVGWLPATCVLIIGAALIKPWAFSLVYILFARRAWVAIAATVVGFAVTLVGLFERVGGLAQFRAYVQTVRSFAYQPMLVSHSVQGVAKLLFGADSAVQPLHVSRMLYIAVLVVGYAVLLGGLYLNWKTAAGKPSIRRRMISVDIAVVATLLGLTVCHMWYDVLLLPVLWRLTAEGLGPGGVWVKGGVAVAIYLLLSWPFPGVSPVPEAYRHGWRIAMVMVPFVVGVALWITLLLEGSVATPAPSAAA